MSRISACKLPSGSRSAVASPAPCSTQYTPSTRPFTAASPSRETLQKTLDTNLFGLIAVTEAFLPLVKKSAAGRIVNLSSVLGSLTLHADPKSDIYNFKAPAYDISKAAVNMLMLNLAYELRPEGFAVGLLNPGPVDTDMMKNAPIALRPVDDAAARLVALIDRLSVDNTGRFWDVTGVELPW